MEKLFAIVLLSTFISCGRHIPRESSWTRDVNEFESVAFSVEKGHHIFIVSTDKPVSCTVYREGIVISNTDSREDNVCIIEFESYDAEILKFFLVYNQKVTTKGGFKYHATII